jgi:hypothetical protein
MEVKRRWAWLLVQFEIGLALVLDCEKLKVPKHTLGRIRLTKHVC